ncbi:MAG: dimethylsulfonioproprionate lyase family protein [Bacillota bacterium]
MDVIRLSDVVGEEFPAGRRTRVLVGAGGPLQAQHFVEGYVSIRPGGGVPAHEHPQEEVYLILSGNGTIRVGHETRTVEGVTAVYIPPGVEHELRNTGETEMIMVFTYAPPGIVSHWEAERRGQLGAANR